MHKSVSLASSLLIVMAFSACAEDEEWPEKTSFSNGPVITNNGSNNGGENNNNPSQNTDIPECTTGTVATDCTEFPEHAHPGCLNGTCYYICDQGYVDNENFDSCILDDNDEPGCSSAADCTGSVANGKYDCQNKSCIIVCDTGFSPSNGKCIDDSVECNTAADCGAVTNGSYACQNNSCLLSCAEGYSPNGDTCQPNQIITDGTEDKTGFDFVDNSSTQTSYGTTYNGTSDNGSTIVAVGRGDLNGYVIDGPAIVLRGDTSSSITVSNIAKGLSKITLDYYGWGAEELIITPNKGTAKTMTVNSNSKETDSSVEFTDASLATSFVVTVSSSGEKKRIVIDNLRWTSAQ